MNNENFINYSLEREDELISYKEVLPLEIQSPSLYTTLFTLAQKITALPHESIQLPIFLSYILMPSAMATRSPILFLYGESGSGKSSLGTLSAKLYGATTLQSSSTYAAIRNELQANKWIKHPETGDELEQNYLLIWDDIDVTRISSGVGDGSSLFTLLKSGISRSTSIIKIAMPGGKSMPFDTFGGKIISTIHPIWDHPGLEELKRRSMPIFFKKQNQNELQEDNYLDVELLDIEDLYLTNRYFWAKRYHRELYRKAKKYFSSSRDMAIERGTRLIVADMMATLYVHLIIHDSTIDYKVILSQFKDYLDLRKDNLSSTIVSQLLQLYVLEKEQQLNDANNRYMTEGYEELMSNELIIDSSDIQSFLKARMSDGSIDLARLDNKTLHHLMKKEGFVEQTGTKGLSWKRKI
ncbi:MAG: hypothetical protein WBA13_18200 [Microcoleaceae cyanobacterium]